MESGNFKDIIMQYLTLRWFTLSNFDVNKIKLFHSLEKALKNTGIKNLCWHIQTKNYLKEEFKKIEMDNTCLTKLKNFENNLQNFLQQNEIESNVFLKDLDFMQQCDKIIYHRTHTDNKAS
ncbi:MAG: hypothetical protein J5594_00195 [Elusimicrobiaceae bacterium]|nr:hypothetical protein [Elusimicrobiaceae bacterium]